MRSMISGASLTLAGLFLLLPARAESVDTEGKKASVTITMMVPADAMVFFDGTKTTQTGTLRKYSTPPISTATTAKYQVAVVADEEKINVKRGVIVRGGQRVAFDCRSGQFREVQGTTTSTAPSYQPLSAPLAPRAVPLAPRGHVEQPYGFAGGVGDG